MSKLHQLASSLSLTTLATAFFTQVAAAQPQQIPPQQPIQPVPANVAPWTCGDIYYVSVAGSDSNTGTLAQPWRTITNAIATSLAQTPTGNPITINVLAGTYDMQPGVGMETFPLTLPARGIKLEAIEPGVIISGDPSASVVLIDRAGPNAGPCGKTPGTVLRGLTITQGATGIGIDTSISGPAATTPDRVYIHRCKILDNGGTGISIATRSGYYSQHVIEENEIAFNANFNGFGRGISHFDFGGFGGAPDGTSSPLIRANLIHNNETGIDLRGANPATTAARIVSNIVRDSEIGISLANCNSRVINNTQGYGKPFSESVDVVGIRTASAGTHDIINNIIWNPAAYAMGANMFTPSSVVDLDLGAGGNLITNWILSSGAADPQFVMAPSDLHVQATSPVLDAGTNSAILPTINVTAGPITARADCGMDIDNDSRVLDSLGNGSVAVEIGADERTDGSGAEVGLSSPQLDEFGNLRTAGAPTAVSIQLATNPGATSVIFAWFVDTDPIPYHRFTNGLGSWRIPGNSAVRRAGAGTADATGTFTAPLILPPAALGLEFEMFFQGATINNGIGTITNRLLLQINE
ncbi:MAG: DUF1565 domain-containing protein [Planctomycetota bacterium]